VKPGAKIGARALYNTYRRWVEGGGEKGLSETAFGTRMGNMGFEKTYPREGTVYNGIEVKSGYYDPNPPPQ
jgi:hypothetical protein